MAHAERLGKYELVRHLASGGMGMAPGMPGHGMPGPAMGPGTPPGMPFGSDPKRCRSSSGPI